VHERLFKQEKKLPTCTVGEEAGQMLFLQMSATNYAGAKSFHQVREDEQFGWIPQPVQSVVPGTAAKRLLS
jgi:hypothetical protein